MRGNQQFIIYCGPMFSGKTSSSVITVDRFRHQGRHIFGFKPRLDDRYSSDEIVSHSGLKIPATQITHGKDLIKELLQKIPDGEIPDQTVVAVDEMFMIPKIADELIWLYKNGVTIVVSTLDLSFACEPFAEVTKILPWATSIHKLTAVCSVCKEDAHYSWRKSIDEQKEILVGGVELYEARCIRHHPHFLKIT